MVAERLATDAFLPAVTFIDQSTGKMVEANKVLGKSKEHLQAAGYAWKQWRFDAAGSLEQTPIEALEILNGYLQQNAIFADASTATSRTLSGAISNLNDAFNKLYMQLGQPVFKAFTDIVLNVQDVLNQVIDTIRPFTTLIGEELAGSISSIWEVITGIKQGVDEMGRPFEEAATRTKEIANAIVNFLKPALFTILAIVKGDWPKAWGILLKAAQPGGATGS